MTCGSIQDVEPVSIAAAALALGAQQVVKSGVGELVKDAYALLKRYLADRYKGVDPSAVENKPGSDAKRASLAEDLKDAGADSDTELLALAKAVIDVVKAENSQAGEPIGVNLEEIEAEAVRIQGVWSTGGGVNIRGAKVAKAIDISNVISGQQGSSSTP